MREFATFLEEDAAAVCRRVDMRSLAGAHVLVTGATGQIGAHFLAALLTASRSAAPGLRVIGVTSSDPPKHLEALFADPAVTHLRADLADPQQVRGLPSADIVIHAAGYGQPARFLAEPFRTISIHALATGLLLEKLPASGRFLFVSTSELYSGSKHFPHVETDIGRTDPAHPRACYIEGKRSGEAVCHAFRSDGRHAVIARLALGYGPGGDLSDQRVLNALILRALRERTIRLLDSGAAVRTYCYVSDAVEIMLQSLLCGTQVVYNVGGQSKTTIRGLADLIGEITDASVQLPEHDESRVGAPAEVSVDLTRVANEFGKSKFVPLRDGLERTVRWYRTMLRQDD